MSATIPHSFGKQLSFFRYEWPHIKEDYSCSRAHAAALHSRGLISFDPGTEALEEYELRELLFVHLLINESRLPPNHIDVMLQQLSAPYYYSFEDIAWNSVNASWLVIDERTTDYPDLSRNELTARVFADLIRQCRDQAHLAFLRMLEARHASGLLL